MLLFRALGFFFGLGRGLLSPPLDRTRLFSDSDCRTRYLQQNGRCAICRKEIAPERGRGYHADHRIPWSRGGRTVRSNLQLLCPRCNLQKGDR